MGLVRLALFLLIIYFLAKLFTRYLLPFFLKQYIHKTEQTYKKQRDDYEAQKKSEGDISIKTGDNTPKHKTDNLGEYIDYEEINDTNSQK